ncbi:MAG TPA: DegV family protein [Tepidiformaceae bacterium]|nr:DegV family protein [Tepidiformaceae bacterium]
MPRLALVTDSTADIPPDVAGEIGVRVVQARAAFEEHAFDDNATPASVLYGRMRAEGKAPRPFGVPEPAFRAAFEAALKESPSVLCLVMPFDVSPSFTTAAAAMLSMDDVDIKILNPGVASAGLCSFIVSISAGVKRSWHRERVLAAVDEIEPLCDTLFVPAEVKWLDRAGRLQLIGDRLGEIGESIPVVRVGTRMTGVALADTHEGALKRAVDTAGQRAADAPLIVTVDHADAPELAARVGEMMRGRWNVERLIITELSATIGSQVGPGAIGIGVAPVLRV